MRYIVITGVNFANKGAEAMMFHLYSYLQNKWPDKKVVALCKTTEKQLNEHRKRYVLDTVSYYLADAFYAEGGLYKIAGTIKGIQSKSNALRIKEIIQNADLCVDASGYNYSSKFGVFDCYAWLKNIEFMKKHKVPVIIMPQSFGPFDFSKVIGWYINAKAKKILKYPKKIYAREKSGYDLMVRTYSLTNMALESDLVFVDKDIMPEDIYKDMSFKKDYDIPNGSVAVIPNQKLQVHSFDNNGQKIYSSVIDTLLKLNKKVYIIRHCDADLNFCETLAQQYKDEKKVIYINDDIDCLEYRELIQKFDYAVASRYHGVVHAYKAATPCVVIGWAEKYYELARLCGQEKYIIDLADYDNNVLIEKISNMNNSFEQEKNIIKKKYTKIINKNTLYKDAFVD